MIWLLYFFGGVLVALAAAVLAMSLLALTLLLGKEIGELLGRNQ